MVYLLLALSIGSPARQSAQNVDLIELNHFYDDLGRHAYDQVILYEWSPDYRRHHVIAWLLTEGDPLRLPVKMPDGGYRCLWPGHKSHPVFGTWRPAGSHEIRSKLYRETWSNVDPERANKRLFDERYRIGLLPR